MQKRILICIAVLGLAAIALGYLVAPGQVKTSEFYAPAITESGTGELIRFRIILLQGTGKTLMNIDNAQFKEDSENAFSKAKENAEEVIGTELDFYDVVLEVSNGIKGQVSGESAGAMFAIGIISAYTGRSLNPDATMSAGITATGDLFPVDGIEEKIFAARENGKTKFIVAKSQVVKNEQQINGITIIRRLNLRETLSDLLQ